MKTKFYVFVVVLCILHCRTRNWNANSNSEVTSIKDSNYILGLHQDVNHREASEYSFRLCHINKDGKMLEADMSQCQNPLRDTTSNRPITFLAVPAQELSLKDTKSMNVTKIITIAIGGAAISLIPLTLMAEESIPRLLDFIRLALQDGVSRWFKGALEGIASGSIVVGSGGGGLMLSLYGKVPIIFYANENQKNLETNMDALLQLDNAQNPTPIAAYEDSQISSVMQILQGMAEILGCKVAAE